MFRVLAIIKINSLDLHMYSSQIISYFVLLWQNISKHSNTVCVQCICKFLLMKHPHFWQSNFFQTYLWCLLLFTDKFVECQFRYILQSKPNICRGQLFKYHALFFLTLSRSVWSASGKYHAIFFLMLSGSIWSENISGRYHAIFFLTLSRSIWAVCR